MQFKTVLTTKEKDANCTILKLLISIQQKTLLRDIKSSHIYEIYTYVYKCVCIGMCKKNLYPKYTKGFLQTKKKKYVQLNIKHVTKEDIPRANKHM